MQPRVDLGPPDAPAMMLLHGQPGSASDWKRVIDLLANRGARVIAVDRPGYGASREPPQDWAGNAASLVDVIRGLGLTRVTLVGWSWGGGVALEAAHLAPDLIIQLVLVGSVGHHLAVGPVDRLLAAPGIRRLLAPTMKRWGKHSVGLLRATSGSHLDAEAEAFFAAEASVWAATEAWSSAAYEQVCMVRDTAALEALLPSVTTPATVVQGRRDGYISMRAARALATALPHAELVPVDGGHLLPYEHPGLLADLLARAVLRGEVD